MSSGTGTKLKKIAPGLADLLKYKKSNFRFDLVAGLSVAAVALPVGIAYAQIAGVPAVNGIYSALFPMFAYALFGSSRQLIVGPDAAPCIMAAIAVSAFAPSDSQTYVSLMVAITLLAGIFSVVAGIFKLGFIANFFSQPILIGYLNGIALIILIGQLPSLFGFSIKDGGFFTQTLDFFNSLQLTNITTLAIGGGLLVLLILIKKYMPSVPGPLVVTVLGILAVTLLGLSGKGVAILGTVPSGLPSFGLPAIGLEEMGKLMPDAFGLMLIGYVSGILTSASFARRAGYDVDPNQEFIGFGVGNIVSGLAQGYPVSGADSRTAVNYSMGAKSQMSGVIAGITILLFLLFFTGILEFLPKTALSAIIVVSAFSLFDWKALMELNVASRRELLFSLITTAGVLIFGVLNGVFIAVMLSLIWLLTVNSRPREEILGRVPGMDGFHAVQNYPDTTTIPGLLILRFDANLVFFNCDHFKDAVRKNVRASDEPVKWVLIDASPFNVIDFTAFLKLIDLRKELKSQGIVLAIAQIKHYLRQFFRSAWVQGIEKENVYATLKDAVNAFEQSEKGNGALSHKDTKN